MMAFPPILRRLQPSSRQKSQDRERTDEQTIRPTNPRRPSHISLSSDWTTCPPSHSPSPTLPKPIHATTSSPNPQNESPLTSWITAPPSPPTSKQKLMEYVNYLSLPDLDQNITYLLSHPKAIPEQLRTPCFQTALKFLADYVLPVSEKQGEGERGIWDFEIERGALEDLMIVGARLGHEYALPSSIRKRKSFLVLTTPTHEGDICKETNGDDEAEEYKHHSNYDQDENEEWLSDSYQHLLGDKDPFDLPICWGRAFGRDLFPREVSGVAGVGIEDEEYDALEGAYPDFKKDKEMGIFGGVGGGHGVESDVESGVKTVNEDVKGPSEVGRAEI